MVKISFGIIVLNGQPFVKYCLRQIYPFAHEIIVVEGACVNAKSIATKDGHSTDGTLRVLKEFKKEEDYDNKLKIITKKGFWSEKDEQSRAYAKVITGDYLWQVDIDEFYKEEDIKTMLKILQQDPKITAISFKQISFWGDIKYYTDGWFLKHQFPLVYRVFKFNKGYKYVTHRPPTIINDQGKDLKEIKHVNGDYIYKKYDIRMYHYSLLFPKQVIEKSKYYNKQFKKDFVNWAKSSFFKLNHPFRVHNVFDYPSWLERYNGQHPLQVTLMMKDIKNGNLNVKMRNNKDVEKILSSKEYHLKIFFLKQAYYMYIVYKFLLRISRGMLKHIPPFIKLRNSFIKKYPK